MLLTGTRHPAALNEQKTRKSHSRIVKNLSRNKSQNFLLETIFVKYFSDVCTCALAYATMCVCICVLCVCVCAPAFFKLFDSAMGCLRYCLIKTSLFR